MKGGTLSTNKQMEIYLSIIILGYFGIKIVYGFFFNYYPDKYYYRNIEINSNEQNQDTTSNIILNAYVPGIWNNEMTDFITLLVLVGVIFIYTNVSSKSFISSDGILNITFLFGYIIGLGYPAIYKNYLSLFDRNKSFTTLFKLMNLLILIVIIIAVFILNYISIDSINSVHKSNYVIYSITIVLVLFGLILSKKNSANYLSTKYFYNDGSTCAFSKYSVIQSSGDEINITIPFLSFIILLLFSYEPGEISFKNLYIFIYGLLLGILVSGISYYGIEYFLEKKPMKECNNNEECTYKEMPNISEKNEDSTAKNNLNKQLIVDSNLKSLNSTLLRNNTDFIKLIIIIFIILILIYLVYYYFFL